MINKIRFVLEKLVKRISKGERLSKEDQDGFVTAIQKLETPLDEETVFFLEKLAVGCEWRFYKEYLGCIEATKESPNDTDFLFEEFCRGHFQKGLELRHDADRFLTEFANAEDHSHESFLKLRIIELYIGYSYQYDDELISELGSYESYESCTLLDIVGEKWISVERYRKHQKEYESTLDKWDRDGVYSSPEYDHHRHAIVASAICYLYDKRLLTKRVIKQLGATIEEVLSIRNERNSGIYICKQDLYSVLAYKNRERLQIAWVCMMKYILDKDCNLANKLLLVATRMGPSELESLLRLVKLHFDLLDEYGRSDKDSIFCVLLDNKLTLYESLVQSIFDSGRWTRAMFPILRKLWWDIYLTETFNHAAMPAIVWHHMACSGRKDERAHNNPGQYFSLMKKTLDASIRESNLKCFVNSVAALLMAQVTKHREGEHEATLEHILDCAKLFIRRRQGAVQLRDLLFRATNLLCEVHSDDKWVQEFCSKVFECCKGIQGKVQAAVLVSEKIPYQLRLESIWINIERELSVELLEKVDRRTLDLLLRAELQFVDENELEGEAPIYNHAILSYTNCILNEFIVKCWKTLRKHELLKQRNDLRPKVISLYDVGNVVTELSKASKNTFASPKEFAVVVGFNKEIDFIHDLGKLRNRAAHDVKIDREQVIIFRSKLFNERKLFNILQLLNL